MRSNRLPPVPARLEQGAAGPSDPGDGQVRLGQPRSPLPPSRGGSPPPAARPPDPPGSARGWPGRLPGRAALPRLGPGLVFSRPGPAERETRGPDRTGPPRPGSRPPRPRETCRPPRSVTGPAAVQASPLRGRQGAPGARGGAAGGRGARGPAPSGLAGEREAGSGRSRGWAPQGLTGHGGSPAGPGSAPPPARAALSEGGGSVAL